MLVNENILIDF